MTKNIETPTPEQRPAAPDPVRTALEKAYASDIIYKLDRWVGETLARGHASSWHYGELWTLIKPAIIAAVARAPQSVDHPLGMGREAEIIERCAKIVEGRVVHHNCREWPAASAQGNRANDSPIVQHCDRLAAAIRALPATGGGEALTAEDVSANCYTTLIGFPELSDKSIDFICDQISRKVMLAMSRPKLGGAA